MSIKTPFKALALGVSLAGSIVASGLAQAETPLRVVGNFSGNKLHVDEVERPFFEELDARDDVSVVYNTMDAIGVEAADALRNIRSGAFDVMSVQIGMASRDEPFLEGIDLAGVSPDLDAQRQAVEAVREAFDARLQERFNTKLMTLWPFGPQMMFCNGRRCRRPLRQEGACLHALHVPAGRRARRDPGDLAVQ